MIKTDGEPIPEASISVIVTTYNPELELFEKSLDSVLSQTLPPLEVIVVDDGSDSVDPAEIEAVAARYDKVRFLRVPENRGPYMGRNMALGVAKGEFVAIQDADDWSHPSRFAHQVREMRKNIYAQVVTAAHVRVDRAGRIQMERGFSLMGDGPMTSLFRRSVFEKSGPFARVRSRGDVEMRERIRWAFGPHALMHLRLPMLLCLADSQTLSQRTKAEKAEYLSLFRSNIDRRARSGPSRVGSPRMHVNVPMPLRPDTEAGND